MSSIAVSQLRANLMKVLKNIERGDSINITSRGKVIARLVPPEESKQAAEMKLNTIRKSAKIHDVLSPLSEEWEAEKQ